MLEISPITAAAAREIVRWEYPPPYDLYSLDQQQIDEHLATLLEPDNRYFAISDASGALLGFICFGGEARVAGGPKDGTALDIGCGLKPERTGQGMGPAVIRAGVDFGYRQYGTTRFRATIAAMNGRALRAAQHAGFIPRSTIERPSDGRPFVVLECEIPVTGRPRET